jgi:hypothetical protein
VGNGISGGDQLNNELSTDVIEHMKEIISEYENGRIAFCWHGFDLERDSVVTDVDSIGRVKRRPDGYIHERFEMYLVRLNKPIRGDQKFTDAEIHNIDDSAEIKQRWRRT